MPSPILGSGSADTAPDSSVTRSAWGSPSVVGKDRIAEAWSNLKMSALGEYAPMNDLRTTFKNFGETNGRIVNHFTLLINHGACYATDLLGCYSAAILSFDGSAITFNRFHNRTSSLGSISDSTESNQKSYSDLRF
ncbi:MAG TPA: hypothetical protein VFE61_17745 [Candidatus Sulfotelmatobacter sp.]|nr:hypothetical protein [Candidatus Sulfotelmatobacter sp.]